MTPLCDVCSQIEKNERERQLTEQAQVAGESGRTVSPTQANKSAPKVSGFTSALRICGVIDLIIGIIGAIGVLIILINPISSKAEIFLIVMLVIAFQGFFLYVFFNVIAEIAESLRAILHKLSE
jgi:F0F1-type ATP synthase assembly protein I